MFQANHNPVSRTTVFGETIIDSFRNEFDFLSNFYLGAPIEIWGKTFSTSEHAYQWAKSNIPEEQETVLFNFIESNGKFIPIPTTPGQAKRAGKAVTKRPDWNPEEVMYEVLKAKFTQHWGLRQKLLATDDAELIEGNTWCDNDWGACSCPKCMNKEKTNMLGKLLMRLRAELNKPSHHACLGCPVMS